MTKSQRKAYKSTQMTTKKGTHAFDVPVDDAVGVQIVQRVRGLGYLCRGTGVGVGASYRRDESCRKGAIQVIQ